MAVDIAILASDFFSSVAGVAFAVPKENVLLVVVGKVNDGIADFSGVSNCVVSGLVGCKPSRGSDVTGGLVGITFLVSAVSVFFSVAVEEEALREGDAAFKS